MAFDKGTSKGSKNNKETQQRTINPEIDAKLNTFISENPKLVEYVKGLDRETLERKYLLGKMNQKQFRERSQEEIIKWAKSNPQLDEEIQEKIKNVPEAQKKQAYVSVARKMAVHKALEKGVSISA